MFKDFPSSPSTVLHSSLGTVEHEGGTAPSGRSVNARRPLFGEWSEMDRNHMSGIVWGVMVGASTVVCTVAYFKGEPVAVLVGAATFIASCNAMVTFHRCRSWQSEMKSILKGYHRRVRNLKRVIRAWEESAIAHLPFQEFGSGMPGEVGGGKRRNGPLPTDGGVVIEFPGGRN